ncbi:phosphoribosylglycinamide formyltransferase [uncultured Cetobacterium sp.]|uniref:phosphoribosylglycinamide formyltransferase n=1 Tax=uncultured Cetobacterium sp. TaxID=527638 RepID=UPI002628BADD|nr:phosphoribosylglycinamide formyltransferase [uncultured Cetobacterium sp.]
MVNIGIFASGSGSNFENLVLALEDGRGEGYSVKFLFSDKKNSYALERAKKLGIERVCIELKDCLNKEEYEKKILEKLEKENVQLIVLAGYMKIISSALLQKYENRIINIHPSYLPNYQGKDAIKRAFLEKNKETGITIHYVDEGVDTGSIIYQEKIQIENIKTLKEVEEKIHQLEHEIYPKVLTRLCQGEIK